MEKKPDDTVTIRIEMNRKAMTAAEKAEFFKDLSMITGCTPEELAANGTFTYSTVYARQYPPTLTGSRESP